MTFSQTTKQEILKTIRHIRGCCATSFLTAVLKSIGSLTIGYKSFGFALESENHEMLTFCKHLAEVNLGRNIINKVSHECILAYLDYTTY